MMDGLDIEEIFLSKLENYATLGAEYYGKKYVDAASLVKRLNNKKLEDIANVITDGDHGSPDYQESGVLYLLSESVKEGYIDISKCRYITCEKNSELTRSELHPGDIVVTKTGVYFGKSAVIPRKINKANTIAHVGKITLKDEFNPYYVSTFLNCKYGYYQMRRRGIKATRPEIKLVEFPEIIIPFFTKSFEYCIESSLKNALALLDSSEEIINRCETILEHSLQVSNLKDDNNTTSVKLLSESFLLTGRLDAEYYQTKFDMLFSRLNMFKHKSLGGENGLVLIKNLLNREVNTIKKKGFLS